jgi:hypothetical protein
VTSGLEDVGLKGISLKSIGLGEAHLLKRFRERSYEPPERLSTPGVKTFGRDLVVTSGYRKISFGTH